MLTLRPPLHKNLSYIYIQNLSRLPWKNPGSYRQVLNETKKPHRILEKNILQYLMKEIALPGVLPEDLSDRDHTRPRFLFWISAHRKNLDIFII